MEEQFELFEGAKKAIEKELKEPPLTRRERLEMSFARRLIKKTEKEHICARCGEKIPAGRFVMEIIPMERGRKQPKKVEYYHLKSECPGWGG